MCRRSIVDYAVFVSAWSTTMPTHVLEKTKKFETVFACSYGAKEEIFDNKRVENLILIKLQA